MNLKNRLSKLENEHGVSTDGRCKCPVNSTRVILPTSDGSTPEATTEDTDAKCDVCGGEPLVIRVVYVEGKAA